MDDPLLKLTIRVICGRTGIARIQTRQIVILNVIFDHLNQYGRPQGGQEGELAPLCRPNSMFFDFFERK